MTISMAQAKLQQERAKAEREKVIAKARYYQREWPDLCPTWGEAIKLAEHGRNNRCEIVYTSTAVEVNRRG